MTSNFDRWEKDPFFPAAEEVQESADRMESAYRRWIHAGKNDIESATVREELRRDLHTALGTAKWQLEEFERAVRSSYDNCLVDDAVTRHRQFVVAIENQTSNVESSLRDSVMDEGKTTLPWVRLDEGERDELALFLVGTTADLDDMGPSASGKDGEDGNLMELQGGKVPESMKNLRHLVELGPPEMAEERLHGHRRIASAADIGTWKTAVADEDLRRPPPRILSFSSLLRTLELKSKPKWPKNWPKNGFRKWKGGDRYLGADVEPLQSHQLSRGIDACYERSKNCLDSCDESYNKQLDGWLGAFQRKLQRSQYKIKYCRPVQITFWAVLVLCLIGWEDWKLEITATVRKMLLAKPLTSSTSANHHGGLQRPNAHQKVHKEPPSKITYRRLSHVLNRKTIVEIKPELPSYDNISGKALPVRNPPTSDFSC